MAVAAEFRARAGATRARIWRASWSIGLFVVFVLVPLYWMVITSIKPSSDYLTIPPVWFPAQPTLVHYTAALFSYRGPAGPAQQPDRRLGRDRAVDCLLGTMMAYSLARFNTGGKHLAFWVSVAALPAAGRHHPADLPAVSQLGSLRHSHRD